MRKTIIGAGLVLLLIAGVALTIGWNAIAPVVSQYGSQVDASQNIEDTTSDADYAMRQYEWFKTQRQDIKSMERKIQNQRTQIKNFKSTYDMNDLSYAQQQQYSRMTNRLLGYRNIHSDLVAEYNARMNTAYRAQYNNTLPLEMEKKFWTGDLIP